jgi:glycylpeptide N-tetradecanoyltransferase
MPRDEVMYTIVIENDQKKITDFVSFYNLPSQILKKEGHNHSMMKVSHQAMLLN